MQTFWAKDAYTDNPIMAQPVAVTTLIDVHYHPPMNFTLLYIKYYKHDKGHP